MPSDEQGVALAGVKMSCDVYYYGVYVSQENKNIREVDGMFSLSSKSPTEAIFLNQGVYYFTIATFLNVNIYLNKPKRLVKIEKNCINYVGTFVFDSDQRNMDFNVGIDNSQDAYKEAINDFKQKFPELSKRYRFKYALLN